MDKKHYMITIKAPREKVWNVMLSDRTYRQWAAPFMEGTYFEGSWDKGSKIRFMAPADKNEVSGMYGVIKESRKPETVTLQHLGEIKNQKEVPWQHDEVALEKYTFEDKNGETVVHVDINVPKDWAEMMDDKWPQALELLKGLAEKK